MKSGRDPNRGENHYVGNRGRNAVLKFLPRLVRLIDRHHKKLYFARGEDVAFDQIFRTRERIQQIFRRLRVGRNRNALVERARLRSNIADRRRDIRQNFRVAWYDDSRADRIERQTCRNLCSLFERTRGDCSRNERPVIQRRRAARRHK